MVQLTKQGFAFVFDRVTGVPVWPIAERPVLPSDVAGEEAWPTQPFPTAPPPFSEQGVTLDDAFDLTPELKTAAQAELRKFRLGPLYTPPSMEGTVMRPGTIGGANWGGGAFDARAGCSSSRPPTRQASRGSSPADRSPANPRSAEVDAELTGDLSASTNSSRPERRDGRPFPPLPLLKPPYGHVVAIDLNAGAIAWRVPFGDNPQLRSHPALKDVALPEPLGAPGAAGVLGTAGGLVFVGGNDVAFHALDLATGRELWRLPLATRRVTGTPMTYRSRLGRQLVLVSTSAGADASLMAFALPVR